MNILALKSEVPGTGVQLSLSEQAFTKGERIYGSIGVSTLPLIKLSEYYSHKERINCCD